MSQIHHRASASPHQSPTGDVVVADGVGEIVLLPRLWGMELSARLDGGLDLRTAHGLRARAVLTASGAVRLTEASTDAAAALVAS